MLLVVHGIQELILVDELADGKVYQPEKANQPRAGENTVHHANDQDEDRLWDGKAVAERRWRGQLSVVSWCFGGQEIDRVHRNAAKLQKPERKQPQTLQHQKIDIKGRKRFQRIG